MKFVLLHEAKNDEAIRLFFMDVWELYVKVSSTSTSLVASAGSNVLSTGCLVCLRLCPTAKWL